jgi:hypothetical protein
VCCTVQAELIQYERRFVELYELVSEKLIETRKYYAMYNTLEDTHRYMTNEVSLLESIAQNFPKSIQSAKGTSLFVSPSLCLRVSLLLLMAL